MHRFGRVHGRNSIGEQDGLLDCDDELGDTLWPNETFHDRAGCIGEDGRGSAANSVKVREIGSLGGVNLEHAMMRE